MDRSVLVSDPAGTTSKTFGGGTAVTARYVIGAVVVVVFVVWGAYAFFQTTVQYVPIEEAMEAKRTVQVMGKIDFESVRYDAEQSHLSFAIFDAEADSPANSPHLPVVYRGVVPGNFDQAESVVVKGEPDGEVFAAEQLLVKCPSKYQGEDSEGYQNIEKHNQAQETGAI
jgi:cytochrome c-type biogenesis protein CcmE